MEIELAWAAGFFDGEGCTNKRKGHVLQIRIFQKDRRVLDRFQKVVGVGKVYGPYSFPSQSGRTVFQYGTGTIESCLLLDRLFPYLSSSKTEQAVLAGYTPKGRLVGRTN